MQYAQPAVEFDSTIFDDDWMGSDLLLGRYDGEKSVMMICYGDIVYVISKLLIFNFYHAPPFITEINS